MRIHIPHSWFRSVSVLMAIWTGACAGWAMDRGNGGSREFPRPAGAGEFGGNLEWLSAAHVAPRHEEESNHYFDLWEPGSLPAFARAQGLTNNHALFIDSHGNDWRTRRGRRYVLRPGGSVARTAGDLGLFSVGDLARVMGPAAAGGVHNILVAGCNEEGALNVAEFRQHFVNATNITYMTPGKLSYKPVFYQAIACHSSEIRPLFGREKKRMGQERIEAEIYREPVIGTRPLGTYVAALFHPGARKPFRHQVAGRELLDPTAAPRDRTLRAAVSMSPP